MESTYVQARILVIFAFLMMIEAGRSFIHATGRLMSKSRRRKQKQSDGISVGKVVSAPPKKEESHRLADQQWEWLLGRQ